MRISGTAKRSAPTYRLPLRRARALRLAPFGHNAASSAQEPSRHGWTPQAGVLLVHLFPDKAKETRCTGMDPSSRPTDGGHIPPPGGPIVAPATALRPL